jgi:ADP-ribosylglycohydrolase
MCYMYKIDKDQILDRAQGCVIGQFSGDSLGALVEFVSPVKIRQLFPDGLLNMQGGGTWNTLPGQPTDDSEMALALMRSMLNDSSYVPESARQEYIAWLDSGPFDCGITTACGLSGIPDHDSQANGALMRVSPIGVFGAKVDEAQVAEWAMQDAEITHPHIVCKQANALMAMAIAYAVANGAEPQELYEMIIKWGEKLKIEKSLSDIILAAKTSLPADFIECQGWVLIAFQNALWQLLHAPDTQTAISNTILQGGDTDTNAAICGALLGAVHGRKSLPPQWEECINNCKPEKGLKGVYRPRPPEYWPGQALQYVSQLID